MEFDSWESYFYPPPDDSTMRNILGERDPAVLHLKEYGRVAQRQSELLSGGVAIPRTFDRSHVQAIHRHLFQDIYEWAGDCRTVNIAKGLSSFADVRSGQIDRYLRDVHRLVGATEWKELDREEFGTAAATVFAYLNQAHPFREGNGRTSKIFMEHVAEESRFTFKFGRVSPEVWNQASMLSGPDRGRYEPVADSLVPIIRHCAVERSGAAPSGTAPSASVRTLLDVTYPQSATRAPDIPVLGTSPDRAATYRGRGDDGGRSQIGR